MSKNAYFADKQWKPESWTHDFVGRTSSIMYGK